MEVKNTYRSAGVLMHITSLPGNYGIGDFGPEAYRFVRKLKQAGQQYWQLLPLNPIEESKGFSPYSPLSVFAGNTWFINPEMLLSQRYMLKLPPIEPVKSTRKANYSKAVEIKTTLIEEAFNYYRNHGTPRVRNQLQRFCEKEAYWLDDYVLYLALKKEQKKPWFQWPAELRNRDPDVIQKARKTYEYEIEREKYAQFLFSRQWLALKTYYNENGIRIIGDIPIYTSHDSADVWAHPEYWKLDRKKQIARIAGVPPDYFNDKGQLWNMPVYDWKVHKEENYHWWMQRLRKNLELFDIVRLDHFRGFSTYWEVKGGARNAIRGKWVKGPAYDFFNRVKEVFPEMPFIAEDLGDVDQPVYDLRDHYNLPGMRILQFAFGKNRTESLFLPHNYTENSVVYTGTHDNNTVKGWFKREAGKKGKKNLNRYLGHKITLKNCHEVLIREAYKSVARIAIIPMQDILGLGEKDRMNFPSTEEGNWLWRLKKKQFSKLFVKQLHSWVKIYERLSA